MRWVTVGEVVSLSLYELRSLSSGCSCRGGGDGGVAHRPRRSTICTQRVLCRTEKSCTKRLRHVAHRACASHCHARARCAGHAHEHMHACRERLTRTLHARERRRCGNYSHMATRADVKRQDAQLTGHWLTVGRLADGTSGANTLCNHARHLQCSRGTCITHTMCLL